MKQLFRSAIHILTFSILLTCFPEIAASNSIESTSTQEKKPVKKKKSSKKKSTDRKKSKKKKSSKKKRSKKRSPKKKKKKKKRSKKRQPTKKSTRSKKSKTPGTKAKTAEVAVPSETPVVSTESVYELSDKIYQLTYNLDESMLRLERARLRLKPIKKRESSLPAADRLQITEEKAQKNPGDIYAQRELAIEYERRGQTAKAKDIYLRMIADNPSNADYHFYLGSLYSRNGQHYKAKAFYEEALEIDPNHAATISALTTYSVGVEGDKMASDLYQKAARRQPDGQADLITQIRRNLDSGAYEEAAYLSEDGRIKYSDNYIFSYLAGESYKASGNVEEAKKSYKVSMKDSKTDNAPAVALGDLYFDKGNYLYAAITYEKALPLKPLDVDLRFKHGLSYFKAYEWTKAASAFEDLLHYAPSHLQVRILLPQVYYIMSLEYNRNGYTDLSRRSFANALSVNPQSRDWLEDALKVAGEFYREHGLFRQALNAYQDAIEIDPEDATSFNGLGSTYWAMHEKEMAIAAWHKSISIQPENNSARGWLIIANRSPS